MLPGSSAAMQQQPWRRRRFWHCPEPHALLRSCVALPDQDCVRTHTLLDRLATAFLQDFQVGGCALPARVACNDNVCVIIVPTTSTTSFSFRVHAGARAKDNVQLCPAGGGMRDRPCSSSRRRRSSRPGPHRSLFWLAPGVRRRHAVPAAPAQRRCAPAQHACSSSRQRTTPYMQPGSCTGTTNKYTCGWVQCVIHHPGNCEKGPCYTT